MNAIYAALLGGIGGAAVAFIGQIVLEYLKQKQDFRKTRLVVLQNCVFLIDSLIAYGEKPESKVDAALWDHARKHNSWGGIFFPAHMQDKFTHLVRVIIREQSPVEAYKAISRQSLDDLREECLHMIKDNHGFNWGTLRQSLGADA